MSTYNFKEIEKKWQESWKKSNLFAIKEDDRASFYVLDMFPYPSGAGLHVGHPLGYIASDIYSRFKRTKGFNVLHPMGFDAFGLPAEQYAIQTGQHPAITTENNITKYKQQLNNIGFAYDWNREIRTSDPEYYKWTQWIFKELFNSWYDNSENKAKPISDLVIKFSTSGNSEVNAFCTETEEFSASDWNSWDETQQQKILLNYRLAYIAEAMVNWCPALGTVLANEEVKDGKSERGGFEVIKKPMKQWFLRITAYADRLIEGLNQIDWSEAIKEQQRNWIGRSDGSSIQFKLDGFDESLEVFSTRPDTIFGASFLVLAPEHELVSKITTNAQKAEVETYVNWAKNRSERERLGESKTISGKFTGAYVIHPFSGQKIPVWIADYVLAGYGTGAVMGVPAHDSRDFAFAKFFNLPIIQVVSPKSGNINLEEAAFEAKDGILINSDFINGLEVKDAVKAVISRLEEMNIGKGKVNFRLRDAGFSRQRYWGEPFPVYYKNNLPYIIKDEDFPLNLPSIDEYKPTEEGEPPLGRAKNWVYKAEDGNEYPLETNTMPGWAGSSWYFLRYTDPKNQESFAAKNKIEYWSNVDLYLGGSEHATGHLLYSRFWTKFLYDRGFIPFDEPFKKLINQGMIQGVSAFIGYVQNMEEYDEKGNLIPFEAPKNKIYCSAKRLKAELASGEFLFIKEYFAKENSHRASHTFKAIKGNAGIEASKITWNVAPIEFVDEFDRLLIEPFKKWGGEFELNSAFISESGSSDFFTLREVEKMSKSRYNVINPDDVIEKYGADTLRLYEMFLGPLELSKPWNTNGIEGVYRFLGKLWRLFYKEEKFVLSEEEPNKEEYKILYKTIKKVSEDIEAFSFNTSVAAFMICVNDLSTLKCNKRKILLPLLQVLSPFAPHISEELWSLSGNATSILDSGWPNFDESYLVENSFSYPISINGKTRTNIELPLDMDQNAAQEIVMADEIVQKWMESKPLKKFIFVKGRIVNIVV